MSLLHMRMLAQNRGLYEAHLVTASSSIQEHRAALRQLQFRAAGRDDGQLDFYEVGGVPEGRAALNGNWILSVGGKPLDERAIRMMGGGAVVGEIPPGLPALHLPHLDLGVLGHLFLMSMIISLLGFVEAISIAKAMAVRTHQRLDPNQELIGQGLGNMVGCLAQSYPVSGSFSRSAVNLQAGARTGLSNVVCSIMVCVVLLFFTPALYHLPQPVLAAVIMMAVIGLLDVKGFLHAWRANRFDGLILVITFVSTLAFAPHLEWGISIGVALSVGRYLYQTMQPPVVDLSLHADGSLRDAKRHDLRRCRHIAAIRFDGPLNFTNVSYLEDKVMERVADLPDLRHVLIVAHGVNDIDASGEEILDKLVRRLRTSGYEVSFSGLKDEVLDVLHRTGLYATIGEQNVFPTQAAAIQRIHARTHRNTTEDCCPLLRVVPKGGDPATDAP
jgi:anti-anti-sigma factor